MHVLSILSYVGSAGVFFLLCSTIWELFFSASRAIPGPVASKITRLWYYAKVRAGNFHHDNIALHEIHGQVVQVAPGHFSISAPAKTIYGIGSKFPKGDWYQGWVSSSVHEMKIWTYTDSGGVLLRCIRVQPYGPPSQIKT